MLVAWGGYTSITERVGELTGLGLVNLLTLALARFTEFEKTILIVFPARKAVSVHRPEKFRWITGWINGNSHLFFRYFFFVG